MKRNEIDEKYKWDLTTIFKDDESYNKEYSEVKEKIKDIEKYKDTITLSSENLLNYLKFDEELVRRITKLYLYANLKQDEDTTNSFYKNMYGKIMNLYKEYSSISSFAYPEILSCSYDKIKDYIKENENLKEYAFALEKDFRYKDHILSKEEERILSVLSNSLNASENAYTSLIYSDMKLDDIKDEEGNTVSLNDSNYTKYISSKDRKVRQSAFKSMYNFFENYKNTFASLYDSNTETICEIAKLKNFNSSLESAMYPDNIDISVYNNLIDTVNNNLKTIYKYYDLKKKILNLDELHLYDIYTPLVSEFDKKYTYDEAKEIILEALSPLGEDYLKIIKKAFNERWIDVYYNEGKRTGAYSSGNYDTNPFILTNFEGKLGSVSTLIHELGHSMHTYFSSKNNTFVDSEYRIFVAEVASTVNEILLDKYLIDNAKTNEEKLFVINNLMELYKSTIIRQTMFAEFEKDMHELKEKGETLTSELLCSKYYELNKKYFGDNVVIDEEIKYEWERIPHFYYNFYVYKYATSLSISSKIANDIYNKKEYAKENYIKFLSLGGSMYPLEELRTIGIEGDKPLVIEEAINAFDKLIDEFEIEYKKVKK